MKKAAISLILVLAMTLAMVLVPVPTAEAAGTNHTEHAEGMNHCACGAIKVGETWTGGAAGVGDHTECTAVSGEWIDLNDYVAETDILQTGNYYLSGNLQLTTQMKLDTAGQTITICLNGYDLLGPIDSAVTAAARKVLYLNKASNVSICDCQGGGQMSSTTTVKGAVILAESSSSIVLNLYSGTLVGSPNCTVSGGTVRMDGGGTINIYNAIIQGGSTAAGGATTNFGGNLCINASTLNMYGGIIQNGAAPASSVGSNIALLTTGAFNMYGGAVLGGTGTSSIGIYNNVTTASIKLYGGLLQLNQDLDTTVAATKMTFDAANNPYNNPLVIDLNGKKLSGDKAAITGKIGLADSSISAGNKITTNVDIANFGLADIEQGAYSPVGRYVTLENEGVLSIHRIYVGFDKIQLYKDDNGNIGMNYVTNFVLDDEVKALLVDDVDGYAAGCCFGVGDPELRMGETVGLAKAAYKADIATNIAAILDGEGDATAIAAKIYANTFVNLNIGGQTVTVTSNTYGYSLQDVVDALNGIADLANQNAAAAELLADIKSRFN